ncbi:hypothetical protein BHE90_017073 [Fusarium euwallaceae]|uniref:Uncharacterized protein n=1 Tax=Fusarium euwallaceae TaxID=1147111 RepID=A0A430KYK8_9HYPO|nr:hypothetical protein BHE90_017073 [Fusarium euwallaceae]
MTDKTTCLDDLVAVFIRLLFVTTREPLGHVTWDPPHPANHLWIRTDHVLQAMIPFDPFKLHKYIEHTHLHFI